MESGKHWKQIELQHPFIPVSNNTTTTQNNGATFYQQMAHQTMCAGECNDYS